jgi:hypothetical protein
LHALGALWKEIIMHMNVADPSIQFWTLIIAGIAAVAAILAAVITVNATSRLSRMTWIRAEQVAAYEAFSSTAWAAYEELATGAVHRALAEPENAHLEAAFEKVDDHTRNMSMSFRNLLVVAGPETLHAASTFHDYWTQHLRAAVPLRGAAHAPALAQYRAIADQSFQLLHRIAFAMRADLNLSRARVPRRLKSREREPELATSYVSPAGDPSTTLRRWRVRNFANELPTDGDGYFTLDTPWALLKLRSMPREMSEPLAAVVRKPQDGPWLAAVAASLNARDRERVLKEIVLLVTSNGAPRDTQMGAQHWVEGEKPGERMWWWSMASVAVRTPGLP